MSDNLIEKNFIYLLLLSLLFHAAAFFIFINLPQDKPAPPQPVMVDLEGIPSTPPIMTAIPPVERHAESKQRVTREVAPKGEDLREKIQSPQFQQPAASQNQPMPQVEQTTQAPVIREPVTKEMSPAGALFRRPKEQRAQETATLYPSAAKMARIEDNYRKKFGPEVADGETKFLNTDDIQFGSFLRRFENSVYGVWRYPTEAAKLGIEGMTPVKITFNRKGEIVKRELLQSSGSKILDNEVLRTLDRVGPVGTFPRGYDKETFNLIAFFHYGISSGAVRSLR